MMKFSHNLLVIKINQNLNGHSTRIGANIIMHHAVSNFSFEMKISKSFFSAQAFSRKGFTFMVFKLII